MYGPRLLPWLTGFSRPWMSKNVNKDRSTWAHWTSVRSIVTPWLSLMRSVVDCWLVSFSYPP